MTQEWKVGDKVVWIPSYNASRWGRAERMVTVTRVGRKYVYVDGDDKTRYRLDGHEENGGFSGGAASIRTFDWHARVTRQEAANQRLRELGFLGGSVKSPFSVEKLEAVIKVLEA